MHSHSVKNMMGMKDAQFLSILKSVETILSDRLCPAYLIFCRLLGSCLASQNIHEPLQHPECPRLKKSKKTAALKGWTNCLYTLNQIWVLKRDFKGTVYINEHVNVRINSQTTSQTLFSSELWSPSSCFHLTGFSIKSPDSDNFPLNPFRGAPCLTL